MNNIVLIGLPGCGKTTIGKLAAEAVGRPFWDLDEQIVTDNRMSIPDIFSQFGEAGFRDRETAACRRVAASEGYVISCGGGVVVRPENMAALSQTGTIVFIDRPAADIVGGVDTAGRPLLKDGAERVFRLAAERDPLYRRYADAILPNTGTREQAVSALVSLMSRPPLRLAVIGDPIDHSLSPTIHLPCLQTLCPQVSYDKIRVRRGELAAFVEKARHSLDGFNLTMPHKVDILPFLDEIDPVAEAIGAVNTVAVRNGKLVGTVTDGGGFYTALTEKGVEIGGKHAVILGTGGVAETLAIQGAERGLAAVTMVGRRPEKADAIAGKVRLASPQTVTKTYPCSEVEVACRHADILINATPQGMIGVAEDWPSLAFLSALPAEAVVCDLIYKPAETRFLAEAARLGHAAYNGLDMLIYQAILADEIYLGVSLGRRHMAERMRAALAANERKS